MDDTRDSVNTSGEDRPQPQGTVVPWRQANWTIAVVRFFGGLVFFGMIAIISLAAGWVRLSESVLPFVILFPSVIFALLVPEQRTATGPWKTASPRSCLGWATLVIEHLFSGLLRLCGGGGVTVAATLILWRILMPDASPMGRMPASRDFVQFALEAGIVLCGGAFAGLLTVVLPLDRRLWFAKKGKLKVENEGNLAL